MFKIRLRIPHLTQNSFGHLLVVNARKILSPVFRQPLALYEVTILTLPIISILFFKVILLLTQLILIVLCVATLPWKLYYVILLLVLTKLRNC